MGLKTPFHLLCSLSLALALFSLSFPVANDKDKGVLMPENASYQQDLRGVFRVFPSPHQPALCRAVIPPRANSISFTSQTNNLLKLFWCCECSNPNRSVIIMNVLLSVFFPPLSHPAANASSIFFLYPGASLATLSRASRSLASP